MTIANLINELIQLLNTQGYMISSNINPTQKITVSIYDFNVKKRFGFTIPETEEILSTEGGYYCIEYTLYEVPKIEENNSDSYLVNEKLLLVFNSLNFKVYQVMEEGKMDKQTYLPYKFKLLEKGIAQQILENLVQRNLPNIYSTYQLVFNIGENK